MSNDKSKWEEVSERIEVLRETARDEFIELAYRTTALSTSPQQQGFFLVTLDGVFARESLEAAFIGYCMGRAVEECSCGSELRRTP